MQCEMCGGNTFVKDTRTRENGAKYRRRECEDCGHSFTTYEISTRDLIERKRMRNLIKLMRKIIYVYDERENKK